MADPETDSFALDGETIRILVTVYLMLNKPAGVITSTDDPKHRTVMDLLSPPYSGMDLFPVGRLDLDTEGLLVITNDGPLTHRLTSPKTGVDKTYYARLRDPVDGSLLADYRKRFLEGIVFHDGYKCLSAKLDRAGNETDGVFLTIQEGKYHQVKKMFIAAGNEVVYLKRVSMGALALDPSLAPGSYRELNMEEIMILRGQNNDDESDNE
jgi:16S rRNA pseudouridine516 synthase